MNSRKNWIIYFIVFVFSVIVLRGGTVESSPLRNDSPFEGPIFVLLYHPWEEGFEATFRDHLDWLKQKGYQTIPLETLIGYLEGDEVVLPPKPILLTFDDGTIENFRIVYPLLQEFGYRGTAFVITGPFFTHPSKRDWWKEVDRAGVLEVEDHSRTHGLIWISPNIVDFYSGEDPGNDSLIKGFDWRLGAPVYEFDEELIHVRYYPDQRITRLCVAHVAQNGGEAFFKKVGWREDLFQVVNDFRSQNRERGAYESQSRKETRIKKEIDGSKKMIEQTIGRAKEVSFFAYPWGVYDEGLILELKQYGYQGALTTDWGANFPGDDPFKIKRLTITSDMTIEDLASLLAAE